MADIHVLAAQVHDGRVRSLTVRFPNAPSRTIDRDTALRWLAEGHSLIPVQGHGHEVHRGPAVELVEVDEAPYLRTDTRRVPADKIAGLGAHAH